MPTYLIHGFRWPRPLVRIHIILQNLDDAAAEWLMAPLTSQTLLTNFTTLYPDLMPSLRSLKFVEQYDPLDESAESKSQPYAYVADFVQEVKLGVDIDEVRGRGVGNDAWSSMVELRDKLAPGEKIAWFVVVCGDIERWAPPTVGLLEGSNGNTAPGWFPLSPMSGGSIGSGEKPGSPDQNASSRPSTSRGFKKFFSGKNLRKSKSSKSLRQDSKDSSFSSPIPPLPPTPHTPSTQNGHHLPVQNGRPPNSPPSSIPGTAV